MKQSTQTFWQFIAATLIASYALSLAEWSSWWQLTLVSILLGYSASNLYRRYAMSELKQEMNVEISEKLTEDLGRMASLLGEDRAIMEATMYALEQLRMDEKISTHNIQMVNNLLSKYHQMMSNRGRPF